MFAIVPRIGAASPDNLPCARRGRVLVYLGILAAVALAAMAPASAIAQTTGASTLVGTVRDSTGAVVPSTKVTVVNTETSFRSETLTNPEGNYTVPYLSPGTYPITMETSGFKRYVRDGVVIRTAEMPR